MIKFENVVTPSGKQWKSLILGARNARNSWDRSDSYQEMLYVDQNGDENYAADITIGPNDLDLMKRLRNAGTDHRKFMRMITVYVDVTAPLYWWKQADQYRIGVTTNSTSTMHKIHAKEFTLEDFSCEHLNDDCEACNVVFGDHSDYLTSLDILRYTIEGLNYWRRRYLATKDKNDWLQMIQLLPSSYNQKRTVMLNYEVLANMYHSRKYHKLDEWRDFCKWIESLPYSEIITGEDVKTSEENN